MSFKKNILRVVFISIFLVLHHSNAQNQESLVSTTIDNENAISIKNIKVDTKIIGDIAHTSYTIEIFNNLDRDLSGEIQFPLSDNQAIVGYALDIEGELRKAVGVNKAKGRAAYENIVSQNIDPALLEKTEGNNFKTRVYPIPAGGSRIIALDIIENLVWKNGDFNFKLPVNFKEKIEKKDISIELIGFSDTIKITNYPSFNITKGNETISLTSTKASQIDIKITPIKQNFAFVQEHQGEYFYYYSSQLPDAADTQEKPEVVNIIWDVSRSRKGLVEEEIRFIKELSKRLRNVVFNITHFNTSIVGQKSIKVRYGNTKKLEKTLSTFQYDAATQYGCIQSLPDADLNLVFSDGLGNYGNENFSKSDILTYTLTSQTSFNAPKLVQIARASGGTFINLNNLSLTEAIDQLLNESIVFAQYKEDGIQDCYPPSNTRLNSKRFTSVAKGANYDKLSLVFKKNTINTSLTPLKIGDSIFDFKKYFAIQKIKELSITPMENKEELLQLGLEHNLLTDYTSLIVLETLEDYISNEIVPPNEEWKELYHDNIKLAKLEREQNDIEVLYEQIGEIGDLLEWMHPNDSKDIDKIVTTIEDSFDKQDEILGDRYTEIEKYLDSLNVLNQPPTPESIVDENYSESINEDYLKVTTTVTQQGETLLVTGVITDNTGFPLPGVNIVLLGTTTGAVSDFDGIFTIKVPLNSTLEYSSIGYDSTTQLVAIGTHQLSITSSDILEEVVVVGYGTFNSKKYKSTEDFLLNSPNTDEYQVFKTEEHIIIKKKESNVTLGKNPLVLIDFDEDDFKDLDYELEDYEDPDFEYDPYDNFNDINWSDVFSLEIIPPSVSQKIAGDTAKDGIIFVYTQDYVEDESINLPLHYSKLVQNELSKKVWSTIPLALQKIKKYPPLKRYKKYLEITEKEEQTSGFYMTAGGLFTDDAIGIAEKIWSNIAEIQLDNHENIRTLAYLLRSIGKHDEAITYFEKILELRPDEPIAHRDLALTYALGGKKDKAIITLNDALGGNWIPHNRDPFDYTEVMNTLYNDYQNLSKNESSHANGNPFKKYVVTGDLRVVLTWTSSNTDIDLHVITPSGNDFYYGNSRSDVVRYNTDITDGYGPEEVLVKTAEKGSYNIMVDFYADRQQTIHGPVGLSIEIYKYFGTDKEEKIHKVLTLTEEKDNILGATVTF